MEERHRFDPATLHFLAHDGRDITDEFTVLETPDGYRPIGPYERINRYSVAHPRADLRLTSPPLDRQTAGIARLTADIGEPCPWVVPKTIRSTC